MVRRMLGSRLAVALFAGMLTAAVVGGVSYAVTPSGSGADTFFAFSSAADGGPIPMESVSFAGTALTLTYIPQNANATTGPPESSCWNVKTKSSCSS
jgi:hypothetical protein